VDQYWLEISCYRKESFPKKDIMKVLTYAARCYSSRLLWLYGYVEVASYQCVRNPFYDNKFDFRVDNQTTSHGHLFKTRLRLLSDSVK
jgi:hypothetical protein